jgi:hypothetical protein
MWARTWRWPGHAAGRTKSLFGSFSSEKEQNLLFLKKKKQKDFCSRQLPHPYFRSGVHGRVTLFHEGKAAFRAFTAATPAFTVAGGT